MHCGLSGRTCHSSDRTPLQTAEPVLLGWRALYRPKLLVLSFLTSSVFSPPETRARTAPARFPDFFILGAAKSGTTSLHAWLAQHPDIAMSEPKEPFFYEAEFELGASYYWQRYLSHWNGQRLVGDARHRNLFLPYVPNRIKATAPQARLVVVLRNPVTRALSHWWHWFRRGVENLYFEDALKRDLERISAGEDFSTPDQIAFYQAHLGHDGRGPYRTYLDSGYYAIQLERYFELFTRDQCKILLMEELIKDPRTHCAELFEFLRIDPAPANSMKYDQLNSADFMGKLHALRWTTRRLRSLISGEAPQHGPLVVAQAPTMSEATQAWLRKHYAPHNAHLEDLLGRRLPWPRD